MSWESRFKDIRKQIGKIVDEGSDFLEEASPEIIEKRRQVCYNCPSNALIHEGRNPSLWQCDICFCVIHEKTKYESQSCPENYW